MNMSLKKFYGEDFSEYEVRVSPTKTFLIYAQSSGDACDCVQGMFPDADISLEDVKKNEQ